MASVSVFWQTTRTGVNFTCKDDGPVVAVGEQQVLVSDVIADHADGVRQLGQNPHAFAPCPAPPAVL